MAATFAGDEALAAGWLDEIVDADRVLARAQEVAAAGGVDVARRRAPATKLKARESALKAIQAGIDGPPNGILQLGLAMPRAKQRNARASGPAAWNVAIATLSEEGIARFTTRRVAERGGHVGPAVYELFDDKAGLVRAMFFEGFRLLGGELAKVPVTADPVADLERLVPVFRLFCRAYPRLAQVMFSRPFTDFEPGPDELAAGASVREVFVGPDPAGASTWVCCQGTRTTWRMYCSLWHRVSGTGGRPVARGGAADRTAVEAGRDVAAGRAAIVQYGQSPRLARRGALLARGPSGGAAPTGSRRRRTGSRPCRCCPGSDLVRFLRNAAPHWRIRWC